MISGDQLFTDTKLIRQLAKATGVSDKKIEQLSSTDVSNLIVVIIILTCLSVGRSFIS